MKRLSITARITLWFTALMTLLAAAALLFLLSAGSAAAESEAKAALRAAVEDACEEIEFDDGELEFDDDLDVEANGVYLAVYARNGALLYGGPPQSLDGTGIRFAEGEVQRTAAAAGDWYVYDVRYEVRHYGEVWVRGMTSLAGVDSAFHILLRLAVIALPFLVLLSAIGGYLLTRRALLPVRQITAAAERISGGKDLSERIRLGPGKDEIYTLANTFDSMFDRLQASFENEKQFTADASHELRTPTAVIIAQCEYALAHAQSLDEARGALVTVMEQARKMSTLIAQLLTLARADAGQIKLLLERIDLSELTELVAVQVGEMAAQKRIAIETDLEPGLYLRGDETLLMRMLLNLMENGVKYGKADGRLSVRLYRDEKAAAIVGEICDDGMGIPPESLPRIWERFYQADAARTATEGGVGLGLAMVRCIAEAHGGTVDARSTPGAGSVFTFILPRE